MVFLLVCVHTYLEVRGLETLNCVGVNAAEWQHKARVSSEDKPLVRANHRFACPQLGCLGRLITTCIFLGLSALGLREIDDILAFELEGLNRRMCCKDVHTCAQLVLTVSTLVSLRWLTACYRDVENWVRRLPNCANLWSTVTGFGQSANCMALLGFSTDFGFSASRNQ